MSQHSTKSTPTSLYGNSKAWSSTNYTKSKACLKSIGSYREIAIAIESEAGDSLT